MHPVETRKVQVSPIHHVGGPCLARQDVQDVDLVQFAIAEVDESRNAAAQIQERVHLDRRLGRAKRRPLELAQAQIDGSRIQRVDRVGQVQPQVLVDVKLAGAANE